MANDRNPYDHYCACHGYTEKPCEVIAKRIADAQARGTEHCPHGCLKQLPCKLCDEQRVSA